MQKLHLVHQIKSFFIDKRPKGFGKALKAIDALFFRQLPEGEILIKTLDGFQLFINPRYDKGIERKLYLTGSYEKGLLRILEKLVKPGDVVVDAGANIGLISIFCALRTGKEGMVLSFEPHPETFTILQKNIEINKLKNIMANQFALGSKLGFSKIFSNLEINRGAASLVVFQEESSSFEITVKTLDDVLSTNNFKKINLLKIDVEGFEMEVLKGAQKTLSSDQAPILVVECSSSRNNFNYSMDDLFIFLTQKNDYQLFKFSLSKEKISKLISVKSVEDLPDHDNILGFKKYHFQKLPQIQTLF